VIVGGLIDLRGSVGARDW